MSAVLLDSLRDAARFVATVQAAIEVLTEAADAAPEGASLIGGFDDEEGDWCATIAVRGARLSVFVIRGPHVEVLWHFLGHGGEAEMHDGPITVEGARDALRRMHG